ncbi:hypothetical protein HETIRDRAFT_307361 [Heterobasidion irregulare TC 32-1]|uniref:Uncharacterized protein n=1 Tax=Heterobasidion irregulare (strain TC 32-1) TaxID=747525 RepID=W4KQV9_HETIT|nr:uncharacterized protein HETIRDRAFT_307361 [Heterobasidion irregulare TC 32-1]ETW87441.1 hypothetical protein HETIRDRAFT_307361 [Heterobasidion irregulare TC 32-1]
MLGSELWIKVLVSIAVCLKRRIAVFRRLQRISRGHMAIGKGECTQAVHEFISQEYARACLIAYESLPKDMQQEGWGRPGTGYDSVQFRRSLLDTVLGLAPLIPKDEDGLSPLHYCDSAVQMARYAAREPTQREFEIGINAALQIKKILEECRLEMLEGSTTEFDRSVSAD